MNYSHIYNSLIERALSETRTRSDDAYYEAHHILPRCMGGTDAPSNIVLLRADEHFLAHQLLVKMNPGVAKLVYALNQMQTVNSYQHERITNKKFKWIRELYARTVSTPEERDRHSQSLKDAWAKWDNTAISEKNRKGWQTLKGDTEKYDAHRTAVGINTKKHWDKKSDAEQRAITAKRQAWKNDPEKARIANEKRREFWRKKREEKEMT